MKFKYILCTLGLVLSSGAFGAYAQSNTDSSIQGHVTKSKTGEHLPYITVMLKGTQIGTQTSSSGHYSLRNVPTGQYELIATFHPGKIFKKVTPLRSV